MGALALRVHRIGVEELWLDETFSFHDATAPGWLSALPLKDVPPLYPLLLHGWIALAGDGEAALRLLSALFGTLFVGATMWAGRELFDDRVALWSGLFAALSPIGVYYSQEARPYALLAFLLACSYALVAAALRIDTWRRWALVSAVVAAVLHTHYLAVLGLIPTACMLAMAPSSGRMRRYLAAMALGALLFVPWVLASFVFVSHSFTGVGWIREAWEQTPPWLAIPKSLEVLSLGSQKGLLPISLKQFDTLEYPAWLRVLGLGGLGVLCLWVGGPWGNEGLRVPRAGRRTAILCCLVLLPLLTLWTISWVTPLHLVGRYDQLAYPAVPLLLGLGMGKLQAVRSRGPALATLGALVLLVPVAAKLDLYYRQPALDRGKSRLTAAALVERVRDGDLVVFADLQGYPVGYQLHLLGYRVEGGTCENPRSGRRFACRHFPRILGVAAMQQDLDRVANRPDVVRADVEEYLAALGGTGHAVHVVLGDYTAVAGSLSVPPEDGLLFDALAQLGFAVAAFDGSLGIVEYRPASVAGPR